jgi:shikimate kinase
VIEKAIAVWLDSDIDTLVARTARKDNRPLLKQGNPREMLTKLRDERRPAYQQAPVHVISSDGPHGTAVNRVLTGIAQWL